MLYTMFSYRVLYLLRNPIIENCLIYFQPVFSIQTMARCCFLELNLVNSEQAVVGLKNNGRNINCLYLFVPFLFLFKG